MPKTLERSAKKDLQRWKDLPLRKPLLVLGARQVGKTFLLESFARENFPRYHLFDFIENEELCSLFDGPLDPTTILRRLELYSGRRIDPEQELLILDEIQHCPRALTSLKYFQKDLPQAFVCGSGSLLGVTFSDSPFPVGKVDRLEIAPMTFGEFLRAMDQDELAREIEGFNQQLFATTAIHSKTWELLRYYLITGGLPEVVSTFVSTFDDINTAFEAVRDLQRKLIRDYQDDFIRYSNRENALHIKAVFKEIPAQLLQSKVSSGRFVFKGVINENSSFRDLEGPIEWLEAAKLVIKCPIIDHIQTPLSVQANRKLFKLYLFDVGILGCMTGLTPQSIVNYDYGSYKGFFAENFVIQQLLSAVPGRPIACWARKTAQIEFVLEDNGQVVPIEVKAGINKKAKSLEIYLKEYQPKRAILFSGNPLLPASGLLEFLPLYFAYSI